MNDTDDDKLFALVLALLASGTYLHHAVVATAQTILNDFNKAIK